MNFKTTITLLVLVVACGVVLLVDFLRKPSVASDSALQTLETIEKKIRDQEASRIEVARKERQLVLERTSGGTWGLPGNWPIRDKEVKELVDVLANLKSRFTPVAISADNDLEQFGLDPASDPLRATIKAADQDYQLLFGEKKEKGANRFTRPTTLRINDSKEVILLAPNLLASLDRPVDYYQQRRLFPEEFSKDADSQDRVERLQAKGLQVKGKDANYTMNLAGTEWELAEPVKDRPDPDKLKTLLTAVPDIWAEQFVDKPKKELCHWIAANC